MSLAARDSKVIWHPFTPQKGAPMPIGIVKAEGAYLYDEGGKKYIDGISSWWVNLHGHSHPYIAEKIAAQARILEHIIFAGFTHEPAVELAERLLELLPGEQARIFYSDNGSTSVEVALKMALQYWYNKGEKRTKIIVLEDSYHGDTFGSMSLSSRNAFTQAFDNWLFDVIAVPVPVECREEDAVNAIQAAIAGGDAAVFIFEPMVQGVAGMQVMEKRALSEMVKLCQEAGVITVADEVFTGFGRTGKLFASEFISPKPDIYCLSKGLTGGTMALGITTCNNTIYEAYVSDDRLKTFFHGHSFTANPIACTAALASLDLLMKQETFAAIQHISNRHFDFYTRIHNHPKIKEVRHKGTILAIELKTPAEPTSYFNNIGQTAYEYFMERGVFLRPLGNVIYTLPPYCVSDIDLDEIYAAIEGFLALPE